MADSITEQNRIDTALAVPSQAPVTPDVLNLPPAPAPPPLLSPELSTAQMSMPGPPVMGPVPQLPRPAHASPGNQLVGLAALAASIFGGRSLAGAPMAGALQGFQRADQVQAHQWAQQQALQHQAQQAYQQQQNEYTDRLQQRQAMLKSEMDKIQPFVAGASSLDDYQTRIALSARALQTLGYRVTPEWMQQATSWNPPELSAQAEGVAKKFLANNPWIEKAPDSPEAQAVLNGTHTFHTKNGDFTKTMSDVLGLANIKLTPAGILKDATDATKDGFTGNLAALVQQDKLTTGREPQPGSPRFAQLRDQARRLTDQQEAQASVVKGKAMQAAGLGNVTQQPTDLNAPTKTLAPGSQGYKVAEMLAYGKLSLQDFRSLAAYSRDMGAKLAIFNTASALNPAFDPVAFERGQKFAANPKTMTSLSAINAVEPNLQRLVDLSQQWDRTKYPDVNAFLRGVGFRWGNRKVTDFGILQKIVGDELGVALGAGTMSDMKLKLGLDLAGGNLSPENFFSAMQEVLSALENRKRSLVEPMGIYGEGNVQAKPPAELSQTAGGPRRLRYDINGNRIN